MDYLTEDQYLELPGLAGNEPAQMNDVQVVMAPYADQLVIFWWTVWVGVLLYLIVTKLISRVYSKS